ncbi:zinc finger domain-containing protein [Streptomyces cucumeris]|uniref:zinc finger domain-containing protein n=1 Tax=Streptomyces cucumeris TaxID=2962890 RepID=UPI003D757A6D
MTGREQHPEHAIRCPWCKAPAGARCTTQRGRKLAIPSHDARLQAWANRPKENA